MCTDIHFFSIGNCNIWCLNMQYEVFFKVFSQETEEDEEILESSWPPACVSWSLETVRGRLKKGKESKLFIRQICCLLGSLEKDLMRKSLKFLTTMKFLLWSVNFHSFCSIHIPYLRWQEVKHHFDIVILKIPKGSQSQNLGTLWRTFEIMNGLPIIYLHAFLVFMTFITFLFILEDGYLLAWCQSLWG